MNAQSRGGPAVEQRSPREKSAFNEPDSTTIEKGLLDAAVSMTTCITNPETTTTRVRDALESIRGGKWSSQIAAIRRAACNPAALPNKRKEEADRLKRSLPGVIWQGVFSVRRSDAKLSQSGVFCADLDSLADVQGAKARLASDPHVFAAFLSPSGNGLKVLFAIDNTRAYLESFEAVKHYLATRHALLLDNACKDVARQHYVSHDPSLFVNPGAPIIPYPEKVAESEPYSAGPAQIILPGGGRSISETAEALFTLIAEKKLLFMRGGTLHGIQKLNGVIQLEPIWASGFRSRIEKYGQVVRYTSTRSGALELKKAVCPEETASALLATQEARELMPKIEIVVACPIMVIKDGTPQVLAEGWHDHNGGVFVTSGDLPPNVPLDEAVNRLKEILAEFDFQSDGDRSRAIASLLSPALKFGGIINGNFPVDVAEANGSQSGKTYRQSLVAAIYKEQPSIISPRKGGVGSLDESISQRFIDGRPFIQIDNFRGKLDSPALEAALTASSSFGARVPHRGEIAVSPQRFVIMLTSNGVETTPDFANRSCIIRIRKRENYQFKSYPEGRLIDHIAANQSYYLGCVFSVLHAWIEDGMGRTNDTRHNFREWAQSLDCIVQRYFGGAPLLDGHAEAQERVANQSLTWLRNLCVACMKGRDEARELIASGMFDLCADEGLDIPGLKDQTDDQKGAMVIGRVMARLFRDGDSVTVDDYRIVRAKRYSTTADKDVWFYTVNRQAAQPANTHNSPEKDTRQVFGKVVAVGGMGGWAAEASA